MTKREEKIRQLRNKISRMEAQREAAIKTLVKTESQLPKLRKQVSRLAAAFLSDPRTIKREEKEDAASVGQTIPIHEKLAEIGRSIPEEEWEKKEGEAAATEAPPMPSAAVVGLDDGLDIPKILQRNLAAMPDPRAPEKKAQRKEVAKQVRQAELTGKRRKVPLSGKAAMEHILGKAIYGKHESR